MGGSFVRYGVRFVLVLAGIAALVWRPDPTWVEHAYVNGGYAAWQHLISPITLALPFSLGDVVGVAGIVIAIWIVVRGVRAPRGRRRRRRVRFAGTVLSLLALVGVYAAWFEASWGWNYDRASLETRTAYVASDGTDAAMRQLRARAMREMNALAPAAHARANAGLDLAALRASWLPVVQRLGDTWEPNVGRYKRSIADPFMTATGTSGFINPFTLESQIASDVLWFELPFDLSHEWTHVAGFAREDEANYVAAVTCIRSRDPVIAYSGWLEIFLYLPREQHYAHAAFVPQVWADFAALRARNARHINLTLANFSWRAYGTYLKTNHVASGVENYDEVTRLLLDIPLDASGLPEPRRGHVSATPVP